MENQENLEVNAQGDKTSEFGRIKSKILEYLLKKKEKLPIDSNEKSEDDDTDWGN